MSLPGAPRPVWLTIQLWRWLRWVGGYGWASTFRAVRKFGPEIRRREAIGLGIQTIRVLRVVLGACVPAHEAYRFRLYRPGGHRTLWEYIFDQETEAFHRWRDGDTTDSARTREFLRDKYAVLQRFGAEGVPVSKTLLVGPRSRVDLEPVFDDHPELFCKPRRGSRSRGAFVVERAGMEVGVWRSSGEQLSDETASSFLRTAFAAEDYLVQPFYATHPALNGLSDSRAATTLRLITENADSNCRCFSAVLEVPVDRQLNGAHVLLPIDLQTGAILRWPHEHLSGPAQANYARIYERIAACGVVDVPDWSRAREAALAAHRRLPGVFAVAWDFVISREGALLLEGNSIWRCSMPQLLLGGMLGISPAKAHPDT